MADELTDEYRCGYCWSIFGDMVDPRQLPCKDVFCISCLSGDVEHGDRGLECPNCNQAYDDLDIDSLPKARLGTDSVVTNTKCTNSNCTGKPAVSYCVECEAALCEEHFKSHRAHFGTEHRTVAIHIYEDAPQNFARLRCKLERHNEPLNKACKVCYKMVCGECDKHTPDCKNDDRHEYVGLDLLESMIDETLKVQLRRADDRSADLQRMDKEAWRQLDEDAIRRKELIEDAERERDRKIRRAEERFIELKKKISSDQEKPTTDVEKFSAKVAEARAELNALRGNTRKLVQDGHVAVKVQQINNILPEFEKHLAVKAEALELKEYKKPSVAEILAEKSTEKLVVDKIDVRGFTKVSPKTCYDIDINGLSGDMVLAGNRSFDVCDRKGRPQRSIFSNEGDFTSIQFYHGKLYTLLKEPKGSIKRKLLVFDAATYKEVNRWELPDYRFVCMLAVCNDKVYVMDSNPKVIKVYSLDGKLLNDIRHEEFKNPVYMSVARDPRGEPRSALWLADCSANCVYKIDCVDDAVVESFNVPTPRGVFCDPKGNVWVWSSKEKKMFIRTDDGKSTKPVKNAKLLEDGVEYLSRFFLCDDKLWGAASGKGVITMDVEFGTTPAAVAAAAPDAAGDGQ